MLSGNLLFAHYCDRCWNKGELEEVTFTSAAAWNSGSEFILGVWDVWLSFRVVLVTGGQCEVVGIPLFLSLSWHPWGVCGWESTVCTLSAGSETSVVWEQQTQKAFHEAGGWFGGECKGGCGEKKTIHGAFFFKGSQFTGSFVYPTVCLWLYPTLLWKQTAAFSHYVWFMLHKTVSGIQKLHQL